MPKWTVDQTLAINTEGGKVIVSAAAGSGKTAVLTQRVINLLLKKVSIDELLIVTFTNASKEEMKKRIKDKLSSLYKENKNNDYIKKQLSLVDVAKITTMDAFYKEIVENNFEKLNIDKNFDILSNEQEVILKDKTLKKVMEDSFLKEENYEKMLDMFSSLNTNLISDIILKIDSFLDTTPYPFLQIEKIISNYNKDNIFYKDMLLKQVRQNMSGYDKLYEEIINDLDGDETFDNVLLLAKKERNYINNFLTVSNFDELSKLLRLMSFDTLRTPKGYKDDDRMIKYKVIRDELKKDINKNYHELMFITDDVFIKEQEKIKEVLIPLFNVVKRYRKLLLEEKRQKNAFSFSDVAHFVIELLVKDGKKTDLATSISKKYKQILIDEYQDTNEMQNLIFNAISLDGTNLFIVGDVKQSIYRFRSACPEIFNKDKQDASTTSFPRLITLSKNFRSRKQVIDFCNFIFENTMSESFGEVSYDDNEKLYLGASFKTGKDLSCDVTLIDDKKEEKPDDDLTKTEKEAILVAKKISDLLNSNYQVIDKNTNDYRKIKPSDIVILLRSLTNSNIFYKALNKMKVNVYVEQQNEYFDNYEIKLMINFLKVIDNPYDDVALMSVLNSSLIDISLNEILEYKVDKNVSLYESLLDVKDEKVLSFVNDINELRNYSINHYLSDTLSKIYKEYNVTSILTSLPSYDNRYKNLMQLINHASSFEKKDKKSLHEFIIYLQDVILNKGTLQGVNPLSDEDNVLITTIHKSKGLEYPVVFLSEAAKNFNFKDLRSNITINEDLGFVCNIKDDDYKLKYESVAMMVYKTLEKNKMLSEELRILYVALTRAKEKIFITGYVNNLENLVTKISSKIGKQRCISKLYLKNVKNYLDIILACLLRHPSLNKLRNLSMVIPKTFKTDAEVTFNYVNESEIDESILLDKQDKTKENFDYDWYKKVKDFKYQSEMINVPSYLSVSNIKESNKYIKRPSLLNDGVKSTSIGLLYHKILEELPVQKYDFNTLKNAIKNMIDNERINKDAIFLIKLDDILLYLTSSIYYDVLQSDKVYKEYPINFEIPSSYYDKSLKSGKILISGVIDLLFVKDDLYTIVDYKTDNVDNLSDLKDLYKKQLDLYEMAIKQKFNAKRVKKYIYSINLKKFIEV